MKAQNCLAHVLKDTELKGAARGAQWDSGVSSDDVDVTDASKERRPTGCLHGKMGCEGCHSKRTLEAIPWLAQKAWQIQGEHHAANRSAAGRNFPYPHYLLLGITSCLRATKLKQPLYSPPHTTLP